MRYKITKNLRQDNPELDSVEAFLPLDEDVLKWIFLVYDYDTPYSKIDLKDRKVTVAFKVGFKTKPKNAGELLKKYQDIIDGKNEDVNRAVQEFRSQIRDENKDALEDVRELIRNTREAIRTKSDDMLEMTRKVALSKELIGLMKIEKELSALVSNVAIEEEEKKEEEDSGESLSTLELLNEGKLKI